MIGLIFTVCDEDERHFDRFQDELERLNYPFAANFDHCEMNTVNRFGKHPLCVGYHHNTDPRSHFGEHHRQFALDILKGKPFSWMIQMDVDETLEKAAPRKITEFTNLGLDIVGARVLDLWEDQFHYRVDGPFEHSGREKLFNLKADPNIHYYHATIHAPKVSPKGRPVKVVKRLDFRVLHWGMMTQDDVEFHCKRWDSIYEKHVGGNPYGTYIYLRDPANKPVLLEVPADVYED